LYHLQVLIGSPNDIIRIDYSHGSITELYDWVGAAIVRVLMTFLAFLSNDFFRNAEFCSMVAIWIQERYIIFLFSTVNTLYVIGCPTDSEKETLFVASFNQ